MQYRFMYHSAIHRLRGERKTLCVCVFSILYIHHPHPLHPTQKDRPTPSTHFPEKLICPIMNVHIHTAAVPPCSNLRPNSLSHSLILNNPYDVFPPPPSCPEHVIIVC